MKNKGLKMKLKKIISVMTVVLFISATTACSTNQVSQGSGSTDSSTTQTNTGASQSAGGASMGKKYWVMR